MPAGLRNGELGADLRRTIEEATRTAQDAVKHLDVEVMVDDAMQDLPDVAMLAGRPRIGVSTRDVTAEEAKAAGLSGITGAYVSEVPADSAAGKAGIQAKDIIVSVDGETIRSARQLARVIGESPDGRALQIAYVRGTAKNTVSVTPEVRAPRAMTWERRGPVRWAVPTARVRSCAGSSDASCPADPARSSASSSSSFRVRVLARAGRSAVLLPAGARTATCACGRAAAGSA